VEASPSDQQLQVLVAEDDTELRKIIEISLGSQGYEVTGVADGDEALEVAQREHPDVVILDWMMPGINGDRVCDQVKSDPRTSDIPVVMMSGRSAESDIREGFACGADEFVTKPFDLDELHHVLASVAAAAAV
jgi:two-component system, OmpR family, phosphate regulon response regulator PhoB